MLVEEDEDEDEEAVEDVEDDESDLAELEPESEPSDFFSVVEEVVTGVVDLPEPRLSLR